MSQSYSKSNKTGDDCNVLDHTYFDEIDISNPEVIRENKVCNAYKKGQTIFQEGNRPMGLFSIEKGKVILTKRGIEGREQITRFAKEGDILGYRSLISGDNYAASAVALDECVICMIPKDNFIQLLEQNGKLALKIMRHLARDLEVAELNLTDMAHRTVLERTAKVLLLLEEFFGYKEDGISLNVSLKREDIANIVGTATESLIRYFSEFKKNEIIALNGKEIRILNRTRLEELANNGVES